MEAAVVLALTNRGVMVPQDDVRELITAIADMEADVNDCGPEWEQMQVEKVEGLPRVFDYESSSRRRNRCRKLIDSRRSHSFDLSSFCNQSYDVRRNAENCGATEVQ